jgi:hypothetical protein
VADGAAVESAWGRREDWGTAQVWEPRRGWERGDSDLGSPPHSQSSEQNVSPSLVVSPPLPHTEEDGQWLALLNLAVVTPMLCRSSLPFVCVPGCAICTIYHHPPPQR